MVYQAHPGTRVVEERTTSFHKNRFASEPEIRYSRWNDAAFLIHLASEQLGVQAALVHRARFATAGFS
jgi:hypothetical protein